MAQNLTVLKKPSFRYPSKKPDTYLTFDSANSDYVDLGTHFSITEKERQFTISIWFRQNVADVAQRLLTTERSSNLAGNGGLFVTDAGFLNYYINRSTVNNPYTAQITGTITVTPYVWHHAVFIIDNINSSIIFVLDGVAETLPFVWTKGANWTDAFTNFEIGRARNYTFGTTYSDIDVNNLRIYDSYLLSTEEAQAQYIRGVNDYGYSDEVGLSASYHLNEGTGIVATDSYEPTQNHGTLLGSGTQEDRWVHNQSRTYREAVLRDGPKAYWRMKELSGFEVEDETGNYGKLMQHYNGVEIGGAGPFPGSLAAGYWVVESRFSQMNAVVFDTADNVKGYSGELWIKITVAPTGAVSFLSQRNPSNFGNFVGYYTNSPSYAVAHHESISVGDLVTPALTLTLNVWHHVVWTKDNATPLREIYVDGVLVASDNAPETSVATGTDRVMIGASVGGTYHTGWLSEVAMYDYKLSAQQVADHYQAAVNAFTNHAALPSVSDGVFTVPFNTTHHRHVRSDSPGNAYDVLSLSTDPMPNTKFAFQIVAHSLEAATNFNSSGQDITSFKLAVGPLVGSSLTEQAAPTFFSKLYTVDFSFDGTNHVGRTDVAPFDSNLPEVFTFFYDVPNKKCWVYWNRLDVWNDGIPYTNASAPFTWTTDERFLNVHMWDNEPDEIEPVFDYSNMTLITQQFHDEVEAAGYTWGWKVPN